MAELVKGTVREGYLSLVTNLNPHRLAAKQYLLGWIEWDADKTEQALLFTQREVNVAALRASKRPDLAPTGSRIFNSRTRLGHLSMVENKNKKCIFEAEKYWFVKMIMLNGEEIWLAFTTKQIETISDRTAKNQEDIVRKSWLTNVTD